ncbi:MAG: hypothetical protein FWE94_00315 [Coriobacteriia bacterium]|nr:hypothetical protein [Coriobacteriia bacterium]
MRGAPVLVWAIIGIGTALVIAAVVTLAIILWQAYERRMLLHLLVSTEAVEAAGQALADAVETMSSAAPEDIAVFAEDPTSVDRRVVEEVHSRAFILADELDNIPLPSRLIPVAEALSDAAVTVRDQAGRIYEGETGSTVLDKFFDTDMDLVHAYLHRARTLIGRTCEAYGLADTAVYGGGLYL